MMANTEQNNIVPTGPGAGQSNFAAQLTQEQQNRDSANVAGRTHNALESQFESQHAIARGQSTEGQPNVASNPLSSLNYQSSSGITNNGADFTSNSTATSNPHMMKFHPTFSNNSHSPRPPAFGSHQMYGYKGQGGQSFNSMNSHNPTSALPNQNFRHKPVRMINPIRTSSNESRAMPELMNGSHPSGLLSSIGSSTSVSVAAAAANIASLINASSSSSLQGNDSASADHMSPAISGPEVSNINHQQRQMYLGHGFAPNHSSKLNYTSSNPPDSELHGNLLVNGQHLQNAQLLHSSALPDSTMLLQRELDQERALRAQFQQQVVQLSQKLRSQSLVEKSYEELAQKYKLLYSQMQQMNVMMERYQMVVKQSEQERRALYNENTSLKAQENVAHDKTMLYNILMERSKKLEEENSSLVLENETYQRQYEKCIDKISKQVVQALLTQKALQEQCLQQQDRLIDLERENSDLYDAAGAVCQARQASSDSRLGWNYRGGGAGGGGSGGGARLRARAASPSADSVKSMPAQHLYWRQSSVTSLDRQQQQATGSAEAASTARIAEHPDPSQSPWTEIDRPPAASAAATPAAPPAQTISIETEFPANNGSPKSMRRTLDRHPSSGSLDSSYHSRGFVKNNGMDVRYQRSISAEALRDLKVNMRPKNDLKLPVVPKSSTAPTMLPSADGAAAAAHIVHHQAEVHNNLSPGSTVEGGAMTDSGVVNDPFADDADNILSKHQSLIVGSMEDLFSGLGSNVRHCVIQEEEGGSGPSTQQRGGRAAPPPNPPPRPRSRCHSDSSFTNPDCRSPAAMYRSSEAVSADNAPPPLPPKQYKGSRRAYKPLPAEPPEASNGLDEDSSDKNTDSESIKQEINALTSKIARMASSR